MFACSRLDICHMKPAILCSRQHPCCPRLHVTQRHVARNSSSSSRRRDSWLFSPCRDHRTLIASNSRSVNRRRRSTNSSRSNASCNRRTLDRSGTAHGSHYCVAQVRAFDHKTRIGRRRRGRWSCITRGRRCRHVTPCRLVVNSHRPSDLQLLSDHLLRRATAQ